MATFETRLSEKPRHLAPAEWAVRVYLAACYRLCRGALDRRRLAWWGQAWAATGPRWTSYH